MTPAWTETSSAETGSSSTRIFGSTTAPGRCRCAVAGRRRTRAGSGSACSARARPARAARAPARADLGRRNPVHGQRFADHVVDRHPRVERGHRVLEHHLDVAAQLPAVRLRQRGGVDAVHAMVPRLRPASSRISMMRGRLPAAGLADEAERSPALDVEARCRRRRAPRRSGGGTPRPCEREGLTRSRTSSTVSGALGDGCLRHARSRPGKISGRRSDPLGDLAGADARRGVVAEAVGSSTGRRDGCSAGSTLAAGVHGDRAARGERAAGRQVGSNGGRPRAGRAAAARPASSLGTEPQQTDRVRHERLAEQRRRPVPSRRAAGVHHGDPVGVAGDDAEVVGDEHHGGAGDRPCAFWSTSRICAWMVTSSAVVGSSAMISVRVVGDRDRDHRPLAHAAGELVRERLRAPLRRRDADERRAVRRRASRRPARLSARSCSAERLGDLVADV